jgi:hypothetical protein
MSFGKYLGLLGGMGGGALTRAIPGKYMGMLGGLGGMGATGMIDPEILRRLLGGGMPTGMFGSGMFGGGR